MSEATEDLQVRIDFVVAPIHESVVIVSDGLDPAIERRNGTVYRNTLFGRDYQLLETLNAGIMSVNTKAAVSLWNSPLRLQPRSRGVNGGLKILVDDVQQIKRRKATGRVIWAS